MSQPIIAYGYRRSTSDLKDLGAGRRVYIDHDHKRRDRAAMINDVLAILSACFTFATSADLRSRIASIARSSKLEA